MTNEATPLTPEEAIETVLVAHDGMEGLIREAGLLREAVEPGVGFIAALRALGFEVVPLATAAREAAPATEDERMLDNFEFRRDTDGKPLWHAPLPNRAFDPDRPYVPDNSPFSVCQLCGQPWPCEVAKAGTAPVSVTGIWLRGRIEPPRLEVLAEIEGEWRVVIREVNDDFISHIVEPLGMRHSKPEPNPARCRVTMEDPDD